MQHATAIARTFKVVSSAEQRKPLTVKCEIGRAERVVLLVEDESLVSIVTEDTLIEAGYAVHLAMRQDDGVTLASTIALDAAVLDINLGGGTTSYPIADVLRSRGVPFLFVTGYGVAGVHSEFSQYAVLQKPFAPDDLLAALAQILRE